MQKIHSLVFITWLLSAVMLNGAETSTDKEKLQKKLLGKYVKTSKLENAKKYLKELESSGATEEKIKKAAESRYKIQLRNLKDVYKPLEKQVDNFLVPKTVAVLRTTSPASLPAVAPTL